MTEFHVKLVDVPGQAIEWRQWATTLAAILNLIDLREKQKIDYDIFDQSIDASLNALAGSVEVQRETIDAIMYALGRTPMPEPVSSGTPWDRLWPTS